MAYTAPSGNAVNFVFNGLAYSAPLGNAVNFSFAPEGALDYALEFDYTSVGVHGVRLSSTLSLPVDVAAAVNVPPFAKSDVRIELQLNIVGSTPVNGVINAALPLEITAAGRAAPYGELVVDLPLNVLATALPSVSGRLAESLVFQTSASGFVALLGEASVPISVDVNGVGTLVPVASVQVALRPECSATVEHRQAVTGAFAASVLIQSTVSGVSGAGGTLSVPLTLTVQAACQRGVSCAHYGGLEVAVSAVGSSGVRGEVAVELAIAALATYADVASQVLFVRTTGDEVFIREF